MDRYKFALQLVWNILSKPDETLRYEALLNKFYGKNVFKHFVMPLDEVLFAGLDNAYSSNPHNFLSSDTTNKRWWLLTPYSYSNSTHWGSCFDYAFCITSSISVDYFPVNGSENNPTLYNYRPSIVLKKDIGYISGDGSKNNPYVVG